MKTKTKLTTFLAIIALAMMAFSQNVERRAFHNLVCRKIWAQI